MLMSHDNVESMLNCYVTLKNNIGSIMIIKKKYTENRVAIIITVIYR